MKLKIKLFLLFCALAFTAHAQNQPVDTFNIGDPAPPVKVIQWVKGTPVQHFEKGKVYVLDFPVAMDDSDYMNNHWLKAFDWNVIPTDFVVDRQGKIAWIGNPVDLDGALPKIVNNSWDIEKAREESISGQRFDELDSRIGDSLSSLRFKWNKLDDKEIYDSLLAAIHQIIKKYPDLRYSPSLASFTFYALLVTNPAKAYEYGEQIISHRKDEGVFSVWRSIKYYTGPQKLPGYIYGLGADLYQSILNNTNPVYKKISDTPDIYHTMATWYRLAGDSAKAKEAERKSFNTTIVQILKNKGHTTLPNLILYNPYALSDSTLHPLAIIDNKDNLKRIYNLYLDFNDPATLEIRENYSAFLHIQPGDSVAFEEDISHNDTSGSGIDFKILTKAGIKLPNLYFENILPQPSPELSYGYESHHNDNADSTSILWLEKYLNLDEIKKKSQADVTEYVKRNPLYSDS